MTNEYPFDQTSSQPAQVGNDGFPNLQQPNLRPNPPSETVTGVTGYTCSKCLAWVVSGTVHYCPLITLPNQVPNAPAPQIDREANKNPPAEPHLDYQDQPLMQGYMGIRLPNAPAPQARSQASFMHHVGNWKCLRCPFEVPYDPSWSVMSDAIQAHYEEKHPYVASNAPAFLADPMPSPLPESVRNPGYTSQSAPEPVGSPELVQAVEQSENKQDCPSPLGDVVERLSNFPEPVEQGEPTCEVCGNTDCVIDHAQFTSAPSEPELPRNSVFVLPEGIFHTEHVEQIIRENQQLRQQLDQAGGVLTKYEEQLAQIRKPIDLSEDDIEAATQWCSKIARESLRKEYIKIDAANRALVRTIAALRLDNAQKDKRIAELIDAAHDSSDRLANLDEKCQRLQTRIAEVTENCREAPMKLYSLALLLAYNKVAGLEQRIATMTVRGEKRDAAEFDKPQ